MVCPIPYFDSATGCSVFEDEFHIEHEEISFRVDLTDRDRDSPFVEIVC